MIAAAIVGTAPGITAASAADDLPPMDAPVARPPIVEELPTYDGAYRTDGPYAALPREPLARPGIQRPAVPPSQVAAVMRSFGYAPLGRISLRGEVFSVAALNRYGDDGRLLVDARTGRIMRFVPAMAVDEDFDEEVSLRYVPPPAFYSRALRPPMTVPKIAGRPPAAPATVATSRPKVQRSSQQQAAVQVKPPAAVTTSPAPEAKSSGPTFLPTGELPAVQPLD